MSALLFLVNLLPGVGILEHDPKGGKLTSVRYNQGKSRSPVLCLGAAGEIKNAVNAWKGLLNAMGSKQRVVKGVIEYKRSVRVVESVWRWHEAKRRSLQGISVAAVKRQKRKW